MRHWEVLRREAHLWALPPSMPEPTGKSGVDGTEDRRDSYAGSRVYC